MPRKIQTNLKKILPPTQYSIDEIFNRLKKIQKPITIKDLKKERQEIKKANKSIKIRKRTNKTRKWTNKKYNTTQTRKFCW